MIQKLLVYFFAITFLSGGVLEKEMSKWDGYWRHYQYHKKRNSEYTLTRFLYVHFFDGKHTKWVKKRHRSLPFTKRMVHAGKTLFSPGSILSVNIDESITTRILSVSPFAFLLEGIPLGIFRPPSA